MRMALELLIFQKGKRMSGKFDVVNITYTLNIVEGMSSKYSAGSLYPSFEKSAKPIREKKVM